VITADPDDAADRHRRAAARREVRVTPGGDAMATLKAFLPADGAVKLFQVSDLLATGTAGVPGDDRGIGARRADALVDLADRLLSDGHIDLTGYLGQPLPDHSQPHPRTDPTRPDHTGADADTATGHTGADTATGHSATDSTVPGNDTTGAENGEGNGTGIRGSGADGIGADGADGADPAGAPTDPTNSTGSRIDTESAPTPAVPGAGTTCTGSGSGEPADPAPVTDTDTDTDTDEVHPGPAGADLPAQNPADPAPEPAPAGRANNRTMSRQGRRPHLTITLSLDTLAGLNDLPALLAGYGSIPADLARSIATSAGTITTALTDPTTGALTTTGELTYRPRQAVRDHATTRTDTCQFPSCRQPAWRCDLDHRDRFNHRDSAQGGRTHECNMGPLCRRHHLLKDHADWHVSIDTKTLILNWTSPTGHTYPRKPRHTTPPDAWIGTAGTTIAEQLDRIAELRTKPAPTAAATLTRYLADHEPDSWSEPGTENDDEIDIHQQSDAPAGTTDQPAGTDPDTPTGTTDEPAGTDPTTDTEPADSPTASAGDTNRPTDTDRTADTDTDAVTDTDTSADQVQPNPPSPLEDHLTNALLRHTLNHPTKIEYEPGPLPEDDPPPF
jgi:hypothetical protein